MAGSVRLAAARLVEPLHQGELDGLCGLYAIINAVRLALAAMAPLGEDQSERLFRAGIELLDEREQLLPAVHWGMGVSVWRKLADTLVALASDCSGVELRLRPLFASGNPTRAAAVMAIADAVEHDRPVLMLLRESYQHFTVVSGVTPKRLQLFDSYGYHWVARASCSIGRDGQATRHRIAPRSLLAMHAAKPR